MTKPILVFGAGGRVGGELEKLLWFKDYVAPPSLDDCDITDPFALMKLVGAARPRAIINLAACALPRAETEREEATLVNDHAVLHLSELASQARIPLVHISTDCVFDGQKEAPYAPGDSAAPINHYGNTKWCGELGMTTLSVLIRTTGVYLRGKPNFLETVLAKAKAGEPMEVVSDSLYTPTDARELARAILTATERVIEDPSVSGAYHFAGPDVMSYLDFARLAAEEAGVSVELRPTTMAEREKVEGFKRPRNAALNSDKYAETFGLRHRPTRECVRELVNPAR